MAGIELATRRALAERRARPGDSELRAPEDPMEVIPLQRPRYQVADVAARIGRRMGMGRRRAREPRGRRASA